MMNRAIQTMRGVAISALVGAVAFTCGCTRQPPAPEVSDLMAQMSDASAENRLDAVKEVEAQAETMSEAEAVLVVPALREALRDSDPQVRYRAVKALAKLKAASAPAVPELTTTLSDEDPKTRYYSAKALAKIGRPSRPALPQLTQALYDEDPEVQFYAAKAIGNIGTEAKGAISALESLAAGDAPPNVQEEALKSIDKINSGE